MEIDMINLRNIVKEGGRYVLSETDTILIR